MFAIFKIVIEVGAALFSLARNAPAVIEEYNKGKERKKKKEEKRKKEPIIYK